MVAALVLSYRHRRTRRAIPLWGKLPMVVIVVVVLVRR
jgi:hypothetical protein